MRAKEFLLEYKRDKTIEVFGPKLLAALKKDTSTGLPYQLRHERTILNSPDMTNIEIDIQTFNRVGELVLHAIETADPTKNKQYTQWLAKCYANEGIKLEDIYSKGADWLETYDEMKRKNVLPLDLRNINRLTFQQLYNVITDVELGGALEAEKLRTLPKGQSKELLRNEHVRIIQPLDEDAAKYYGNGTQWCTASRNNNMFDHYTSQGPLFILLPKFQEYEGEKYQIHAESGQFMNEQDEPVSPIKLVKVRFGDILPVLKNADPVMNQTIIFADDVVLENIMSQVKDLSGDFISDKLTEWESQDEYFYPWLKDQGYIDDNGDIDYEKAPTYFDYNPDAEEYYNKMTAAVDLSPNEIRDAADAYAEEYGVSPLIEKFEELVAYSMKHEKSQREREMFDDLAEWIDKHIAVSNTGKVTKWNSKRNAFD